MPSSVPSPNRRRLVKSKSNPHASILVDREVSVVNSPAGGSNKSSMYRSPRWVPNRYLASQINQSSSIAIASAPILHPQTSLSKISDTPSRPHRGKVYSPRDPALLRSNWEGMAALSEFLMRSEPPRSNFMSRPESDDGSIRSRKKSAFNLFGRPKSKKPKRLRLMRLPDSAVAAKTSGGARHIAISIPLRYDNTPLQYLAPRRPHSQPEVSERATRGAVVVLKPVAEVRESSFSFLPSAAGNIVGRGDDTNSRAEPDTTAAAKVLDPEAAKSLKIYHTQLSDLKKRSNVEPKAVAKQEPVQTRKSHVAVSAVDICRQDSTRTDPRHSGGTEYSTASLGTYPAHSRGPSTASSAPSANPISSLELDLQPPKSRKLKVLHDLGAEFAESCDANNGPSVEQVPPRSSVLSEKSANESIASGSSASQSPTDIFGTAEMAQGYNAGVGVQTIKRSSMHKSLPLGPPPLRKLPDVPGRPCIAALPSSPSPLASKQSTPIIGGTGGTASNQKEMSSVKGNMADSIQDTEHTSRKERVRAKKQQDIEKHKDILVTRVPLAPKNSPNTQIQAAGLARHTKHPPLSQELARGKKGNKFSGIMIVANLAPFAGLIEV